MRQRLRLVFQLAIAVFLTLPLSYSTFESEQPSVFTNRDSEAVVRKALVDLAENIGPNTCLWPDFKNNSFWDYSLYALVKKREKIPAYLIPKNFPICNFNGDGRSKYGIGRPDFRTFIDPIPTVPQIRRVDVAGIPVEFFCDSEHICGTDGIISYLRFSQGDWRYEGETTSSISM
jgi:hypothetical protein